MNDAKVYTLVCDCDCNDADDIHFGIVNDADDLPWVGREFHFYLQQLS